jgi:uncharacterized protein YyaL (SSP411 family)
MLYDNALLLRVYLHLWRETGSALADRVVRETAAFLLGDLRTAEGGFASALDADAAGEEGLTYAWTPAQLVEVLGPEDGAWAAELFSVTAAGTFEHGASTLQLRADPDDHARWVTVREQLLAAREGRPQPDRDDKVVTAWNGLAIAALAEAGALLGEPAWVMAAETTAELLLTTHLVHGRLRRSSRNGTAGQPAGVLEDYADLAEGLLALHQATGGPRWLAAAAELLDTVLARFGDGKGGYHDTADDAEQLIRRPWDPTDGPTPSGMAAAAGALLTHAALSDRTDHREAADAALAALAPVVVTYPRAGGWAAAVAEAALAGPLQVAVALPAPPAVAAGAAGPAQVAVALAGPALVAAAGSGPLLEVARRGTSPGLVVVAGQPDAPGVPLLAQRPLVDGRAAAYVCRGFVCDRPTTDPAALAGQLRALR